MNPPASFSLMSYNIFLGGVGRMDAITAVVRETAPDLLGIQEADDEAAIAHLAQDAEMTYVYGRANLTHHIALLSRFPLIDSTNHPHPGIMRKTLLEAHVRLPNGAPLLLFVTHLSASLTVLGERHRLREMEAILGTISDRIESPHLFLGDYNAIAPGDGLLMEGLTTHYATRVRASRRDGTPRLHHRVRAFGAWLDRGLRDGREPPKTLLPRALVRRVLDTGYVDCYRASHPTEPGYTFPASDPAIRFDYIFAPPVMRPRLLTCDVVDLPAARSASDHRPVLARFALEAP
ncbi:MAG: endonuclease/exonuclease/phosphatase family protein [Chloroflexota bacterium]